MYYMGLKTTDNSGSEVFLSSTEDVEITAGNSVELSAQAIDAKDLKPQFKIELYDSRTGAVLSQKEFEYIEVPSRR